MNVLSLFSGCGGMDIGFEGNFKRFSDFEQTGDPQDLLLFFLQNEGDIIEAGAVQTDRAFQDLFFPRGKGQGNRTAAAGT